jgi:hypothetical protein
MEATDSAIEDLNAIGESLVESRAKAKEEKEIASRYNSLYFRVSINEYN